jgi:hypothetical protein
VTDVDGALQSWTLHARTKPQPIATLDKLAVKGLEDASRDWLVFTLKSTENLPATPLRMRDEPVLAGERIWLVGCPYSEETCVQNVYACMVIRRRAPDRFDCDLDPPVELRGFSGAPFVDAKGQAVGVLSGADPNRKVGANNLEAWGEDIAFVSGLVK